jgi:hypothetical protein
VIELPGGSSIAFEAVDPVTGAAVSGVTVSEQAVTAVDLSADQAELPPIKPPPVNGAYLEGV